MANSPGKLVAREQAAPSALPTERIPFQLLCPATGSSAPMAHSPDTAVALRTKNGCWIMKPVSHRLRHFPEFVSRLFDILKSGDSWTTVIRDALLDLTLELGIFWIGPLNSGPHGQFTCHSLSRPG